MTTPARAATIGWMGATHASRASDLRELVGVVSRLRDAIGVLSITIGVEPGAASGGRPAWEIVLENDLTQLRHDHRVARALERRLAVLAPRLADLLATTSWGRGRALYVGLESGTSAEVTVRQALSTAARLGPIAHVLPLLTVLDEGEPAGLVSASRDAIVVLESELRSVSEVDRLELEPWLGDWWPEMKGPAAFNPLRGQHTFTQRDRYARRVAAAYRHTFHEAVAAVGSLARERGWRRAVLAGDPRRIKRLQTVLHDGGLVVSTVDANLEGLRAEEAHGRLEAALETLVVAQTVERARLAVAENAARRKGACGLAPVLAALAEGRVKRLLIDATMTFAGAVGAGERLMVGDGLHEPVELTDHIVARALATGAAVTPVRGAAAEPLSTCGGIAALLRW